MAVSHGFILRNTWERKSSELGQHADITSNTYYDWFLDHGFMLVPAQAFVGQFLTTFKDYPQRQKAPTFNMDEVLRKLQEGTASK